MTTVELTVVDPTAAGRGSSAAGGTMDLMTVLPERVRAHAPLVEEGTVPSLTGNEFEGTEQASIVVAEAAAGTATGNRCAGPRGRRDRHRLERDAAARRQGR